MSCFELWTAFPAKSWAKFKFIEAPTHQARMESNGLFERDKAYSNGSSNLKGPGDMYLHNGQKRDTADRWPGVESNFQYRGTAKEPIPPLHRQLCDTDGGGGKTRRRRPYNTVQRRLNVNRGGPWGILTQLRPRLSRQKPPHRYAVVVRLCLFERASRSLGHLVLRRPADVYDPAGPHLYQQALRFNRLQTCNSAYSYEDVY
ncbi:hypothetical protein BDZ94DRAFT_1237262 [Collybia nuda]|uniref:Uncharacterized protein n=1 Tax=Collybia nuda TaxID=64659 RepID=A0A9P5Y454_9AGAR|nr:hypothetical protein BDZ94DRAFT_1237262 [Collybia nuda]